MFGKYKYFLLEVPLVGQEIYTRHSPVPVVLRSSPWPEYQRPNGRTYPIALPLRAPCGGPSWANRPAVEWLLVDCYRSSF